MQTGTIIRNSHALKLGAYAVFILTLAGCSAGEFSDLQAYVQEVKARPAGRIAPMPEFETYETFVYADRELRDPFAPKEEISISAMGQQRGSGLNPDMNRNKEALENFPLDGLKYVGLLSNKSETWAIVRAPDNLVYRAKVGNHLGQNYGEIVGVDEARIQITEIIPDGLGGWTKRQAALAIEE